MPGHLSGPLSGSLLSSRDTEQGIIIWILIVRMFIVREMNDRYLDLIRDVCGKLSGGKDI